MRSTTIRILALALGVVVLAAADEWFLAAMYGEDQVNCGVSNLPLPLPDLPEASGITHSRRTADLYWSFNDSGEPTLFGVDSNANVTARVRVSGAALHNWEDISAGPCGANGNCLYIADIGDNSARRASIQIYRVPEPSPRDGATQAAERYDGRYPDGAHDAEAAFVLPDGRLFLVTKDKYAGVYQFPLESGKTSTLQLVARLPLNNVTDADASPDGNRIAVRTKQDVVFFRTTELLQGDVEHGDAVSTLDVGEPQGEGVTFGPSDMLVLTGEGGGRKTQPRPGTFATLQCRFAGEKQKASRR
ncbi:MAG TPA: hypothetical protein VL173_05770 [Vicinamibacterales bacterium]|nr:hypothetical protein [Vicinamibacterales bacterium]